MSRSKPKKRLTIRFHTSSIEKFLQARLVFKNAGLTLGYFKESQDPYVEDYLVGKRQLLDRAIREILDRLGANSPFFVEDTSVRIEALSKAEDFPGLHVKEWFRSTSFEQLDRALLSCRDDRRATVFSDIALYIPGLGRPVFVGGETRGFVAGTPPKFEPDGEHPWLTPDTFNGWFVPEGASKRLGEMPVEESFKYDFRVRALKELVARLEEFTAVLNLPTGSYARPLPVVSVEQPMLFPESPLLVVVGRVCAGKTTLGNHAVSADRNWHIEASEVMKELAELHGVQGATLAEKARALLGQMGPDVVAREIEDRFGASLDAGVVITGFRTLEEVWYVRERHPRCRVVLVECGSRIRFERHLLRGRISQVKTFSEFLATDRNQRMFGLLGRVADICDLKVVNEGAISEYEKKIDIVLEGGYEHSIKGRIQSRRTGGVHVVNREAGLLRSSRLFRCLRALVDLGRAASCQDIAALTQRGDRYVHNGGLETVSDRHVNWILKDVPELARRVERMGYPIHYEIVPAGQTYVEMIGHNAWNLP